VDDPNARAHALARLFVLQPGAPLSSGLIAEPALATDLALVAGESPAGIEFHAWELAAAASGRWRSQRFWQLDRRGWAGERRRAGSRELLPLVPTLHWSAAPRSCHR